jgi:hypothetical protein
MSLQAAFDAVQSFSIRKLRKGHAQVLVQSGKKV